MLICVWNMKLVCNSITILSVTAAYKLPPPGWNTPRTPLLEVNGQHNLWDFQKFATPRSPGAEVHDSFTTKVLWRFVRHPCETFFHITLIIVLKSCGRCPAESRTFVRLRRNLGPWAFSCLLQQRKRRLLEIRKTSLTRIPGRTKDESLQSARPWWH